MAEEQIKLHVPLLAFRIRMPEVEYSSVKFGVSHGTAHSLGPLGASITSTYKMRAAERIVAPPTTELAVSVSPLASS